MMSQTRLLICDLDNTLYDWVGFFVPSFYAMAEEASRILDCSKERLLDDLKEIHQKYHDSEHPFSLLETKIVTNQLAALSVEDRRKTLDPAFRAFNSARKQSLALYPGVIETLSTLREEGVKLIAHSESRVYSVMFRTKFLGISDFFEKIYCVERPEKTMVDQSRAETFWKDFPTQKIVEVAHHERKPNPDILRQILVQAQTNASETAYIGDSLAKDVAMAKRADCVAIWAKYGSRHDSHLYEKLVRVSHWTTEEIRIEAKLKAEASAINPDFVAEHSFAEILDFLIKD